MDFNKIRKVCRVVRIVVGLALIATGVISGNNLYFLGVIPVIAGIVNFCPICQFTNKCEIPQNKES